MTGAQKKCNGLKKPESNYFKVPNEFIDILPHLSGGATKLALYIIRHTWGFAEFSTPKKITIDEFAHGRKRKDGSRIDSGAGSGERGMTGWLKELEEIGLIQVHIDETDKARIQKRYQIVISSDETDNTSQCTNVDMQKTHIEQQETQIYPARNADRTEKDTIVRNLKKDKSLPSGNGGISPYQGFFSDGTEETKPTVEKSFAEELYKGLLAKRKITSSPKISTWTSQIKKFLEITGISNSHFQGTMYQYLERIDEEYMPIAFCAQSFCDKFPKIVLALKRNSSNSSEDQTMRVAKLLTERKNSDGVK